MEQEFLKDMIARLETLGGTYAITGSVAILVWGTPQTTHDGDVVGMLEILGGLHGVELMDGETGVTGDHLQGAWGEGRL